MVINLFGAALVYCLAVWVVPIPPIEKVDELRWINLVLAASYGVLAVVLGVIHLNVTLTPMVRWVRAGADPDDPGRWAVLRAPMMVATRQGLVWLLAAVLFALLNLQEGIRLAVDVFLIVGLTAWSTSAFTYLAAERALRAFARMALEGAGQLPKPRNAAWRMMVGWGLASGVMMVGAVLVGVFTLVDDTNSSVRNLAVTMIALGGLGLLLGGLAAYLAAKASADPLRSLRLAVEEVERGNYGVTVPIYDVTEIGHLQAGFNRMAAGLQEREQIRKLFGRHVGEDVARQALSSGVELGGEAREVAVLFVDIIGSTTIAEDRDPVEVVSLLNRFFAVVVDVIDAHGGWINKFEGDAALAIWGAPSDVPDRCTKALRAARCLADRLRAEVPELRAGIGVSAGRAVAGNIGADQRSEYTVIGDPVNEAARLTDLAKEYDALVLARADLLDAADADELAHWQRLEPVLLRGRTTPTPVTTPTLR